MSSSAIVFLHPAKNVFKFHSVTYSHVNATLGFSLSIRQFTPIHTNG